MQDGLTRRCRQDCGNALALPAILNFSLDTACRLTGPVSTLPRIRQKYCSNYPAVPQTPVEFESTCCRGDNLNRQHGNDRFWTEHPAVDREAGSTTVRLHRETEIGVTVAAEVRFWDASGQYFLETLNGNVPLEIIEELIIEAKDLIRYK